MFVERLNYYCLCNYCSLLADVLYFNVSDARMQAALICLLCIFTGSISMQYRSSVVIFYFCNLLYRPTDDVKLYILYVCRIKLLFMLRRNIHNTCVGPTGSRSIHAFSYYLWRRRAVVPVQHSAVFNKHCHIGVTKFQPTNTNIIIVGLFDTTSLARCCFIIVLYMSPVILILITHGCIFPQCCWSHY